MRNRLSTILRYNLPTFVREDHELFVAFVQAYYEWMEEDGNILAFLQNFEQNMDVDRATDEYLEAFIQELAITFPKNILIDKATLLKTIKEFYIAKGSEQSYRFLFTLLFDTQIELQYPKILLHRSSSGKYFANDFATITANNEFKFDLSLSDENISAEIEGVTSGAKAIIDSFSMTFIAAQKVFLLDISSYQGAFIPNEDVYLRVNETTVIEKMYGTVNRIVVNNGGTNYKAGDQITITDPTGQRAQAKIKRLGNGAIDSITIESAGTGYEVGQYISATPVLDSPGYGFLGEIVEVGAGGEILKVRINNGGYDYSKRTLGYVKTGSGIGALLRLNGDNIGKIIELDVFSQGVGYDDPADIVISIDSEDGTGADLTPIVSGIFNETKRYTNADDFPSNYNRIQDSNYYQDFSYVLQSTISPHRWLEQIKRINHPAGTKLFGSLAFVLEFNIAMELATRFRATVVREKKLTYEFDIPNEPTYITRVITLVFEDGQDSVCSIDQTLRDLDYMKFLDTFDYTIEPFANLTIGDVISPCQVRMAKTDGVELTIT